MKKVLIVTLCVVLLISSMLVFTACDTGEYKYSGVLGTGTIKLKMFKKVEVNVDIQGFTYASEGKYEIKDADESGNRPIELYLKVDDKDVTIYGYLNKEGHLIINNTLRFVK